MSIRLSAWLLGAALGLASCTIEPVRCEGDQDCPSEAICTEAGQCIKAPPEVEACDPLSTDPTACGCPAVVCGEWEQCVGGVCTCDEERTWSDPYHCGCPEIDCSLIGLGEEPLCVSGGCVCNPNKNQQNSANCACSGACPADQICQAGRCVCNPSSLPCGDRCLPAGQACCDVASGAACPADYACERATSGGEEEWTCRPDGTRACYSGQGVFIGFCQLDEVCARGGGDQLFCVPQGHGLCFSEGEFAYACNPGSTCAPAPDHACVPNGWSVCGDAETQCPPGTVCDLVCPAGGRCERAAAVTGCRPAEASPCYWDGIMVGLCPGREQCVFDRNGAPWCLEPGNTLCDVPPGPPQRCPPNHACTPGGCLPQGWGWCGQVNGHDVECAPGQQCARLNDQPTCILAGEQVCSSVSGLISDWVCPHGWTCGPPSRCVPPGWIYCASGAHDWLCPPQTRCMYEDPARRGCEHEH